MLTRVQSKRNLRKNHSDFLKLEDEVTSHPAWKGSVSLEEVAEMLTGHSPYTFVLSKGFDRYHYILSYVSSSTVVKHKNVRILMENGITIFRNGSNGGPSRSINDLVLRCLNCSSQVCKPLKH